MSRDWSRPEVEATVTDYLAMLDLELRGEPYSKAEHRRNLMRLLDGRSEPSIEFKHANISAVLIELGVPYISGYKPRGNYQQLLAEVVAERLAGSDELVQTVVTDVEREVQVPTIDDILAALTDPPEPRKTGATLKYRPKPESRPLYPPALPVNYLEREARNRSLGEAGEMFVLRYEQARLAAAGAERLAAQVEHTSRVHGDGAGYDILSFDTSGRERLIEVKTTKYGRETPFFASRNEVEVSQTEAERYHLYRCFDFRQQPRLFTLQGALPITVRLEPVSYQAFVT